MLNAANEVAVEAFLNRLISFPDIAAVIGSVLENHQAQDASDLETVLRADAWARENALALTQRVRRAAEKARD